MLPREGGNTKKTLLTLFELQEDRGVSGVAAEVAATLLIPEQHILPELELLRPLQPLRLQRRLVQVQQAANDEGVVVEKAGDRRGSAECAGGRGDVGGKKSEQWERRENEDSFH